MSSTTDDQELLKECAPVLLLIANTLIRDPKFSLDLLEITTRRLLLPKYRHERDQACNPAEAIHKATQALWCSQHDVEDIIALMHLLVREKKFDEALDYINKALEIFPNKGEYHHFKSTILEQQHQFQESLCSLETAMKLLPAHLSLKKDHQRLQEKLSTSSKTV